jgi:hypothetical protein
MLKIVNKTSYPIPIDGITIGPFGNAIVGCSYDRTIRSMQDSRIIDVFILPDNSTKVSKSRRKSNQDNDQNSVPETINDTGNKELDK